MSNHGQDWDALDERVASLTARKVRMHLAANERTQHDAAVVLGLSDAGITRRLKGRVAFTAAELYRLSLFLATPVEDLLPRQDSNLQPADYPQVAA